MSTTARRSTNLRLQQCHRHRDLATHRVPDHVQRVVVGRPARTSAIATADSGVRDRLRPAGLPVVRQIHHDHPSLLGRGPWRSRSSSCPGRRDRAAAGPADRCRPARCSAGRPGRRRRAASSTISHRRPHHRRRCQQPVCQCRRSATGESTAHEVGSAGQTTTCGVAGGMDCEQPGQRYSLVAAAPATLRTTQRPSPRSSARACPELSGRGGRRCLLGRRATPEV